MPADDRGAVIALHTDVHKPNPGRELADQIAAVVGAGNPDTPPVLRCCPNPLLWTDTDGWVHLATGLPMGHHPGHPTDELATPGWEAIAAALEAAAKGSGGLRAVEHPELPGARLVGPRGEAYLLPKAAGITVEFWHPRGEDAYRIQRGTTLSEAVTLAVDAVADKAGRRAYRAWSTGGPGRPP